MKTMHKKKGFKICIHMFIGIGFFDISDEADIMSVVRMKTAIFVKLPCFKNYKFLLIVGFVTQIA